MPITTTPSGGPQGEFSTYTPIYSQTLSSNTSSITFSNIPTTFTDLVLVCSARSAWTSDEYEAVGFRFNGDSSSNYSTTFVAGNGSSAVSFRESTQPQITARMNPSTSSNTAFSSIIVQIQNYSNATTNKTVLIRSNSSVEFYEIAANVGTWRSTSPITSLFVGNARANLVAGSTFTLYGIKAASPAPKAIGGDRITTDGVYSYHAFLSSGSFIPQTNLTCDYLVIAGGGGGGGQIGGGGGAGGLRYIASQSFIANTIYPAIVGGGGGGTHAAQGEPISGNNSSFASTNATGGGGGGGNGGDFARGKNGGSSGGAGEFTALFSGNAGGYTPVEGYSGGNAEQSPNYGSGGGGGAGGNGANGTTTTGGNGGVGVNTYSAWATATGTGVSGFYAGGGGGSIIQNSGGGSGGAGGGGRGGAFEDFVQPTSGTVNTGGGGGGQASNNVSFLSGQGGSGIVIVRYPV